MIKEILEVLNEGLEKEMLDAVKWDLEDFEIGLKKFKKIGSVQIREDDIDGILDTASEMFKLGNDYKNLMTISTGEESAIALGYKSDGDLKSFLSTLELE